MAQLVAHLLCKQGVTGSSPVGSTTDFYTLCSPRWAMMVVRLGDSLAGIMCAGGDRDGSCVTGDRRTVLLMAGA